MFSSLDFGFLIGKIVILKQKGINWTKGNFLNNHPASSTIMLARLRIILLHGAVWRAVWAQMEYVLVRNLEQRYSSKDRN